MDQIRISLRRDPMFVEDLASMLLGLVRRVRVCVFLRQHVISS